MYRKGVLDSGIDNTIVHLNTSNDADRTDFRSIINKC